MNNENYSDIINMPHHRSKRHTPMARENRAAQFAPFAALTGFGDAVKEKARLTANKKELTEEQILELNRKLNFLNDHLKEKPCVSIIHFVPDKSKSGGEYVATKGIIKRIDPVCGTIEIYDDITIGFDDIILIEEDILTRIDLSNTKFSH